MDIQNISCGLKNESGYVCWTIWFQQCTEDHPQYDCALLCYAVKEKVIQLSIAPLARDTTVLNINIIKGKWII